MNQNYPNYSIQISTPDMFTPPEDKLCSSDHTWHGCGIMWHSSLDSTTTRLTTIHPRFTGVITTIENLKFLFLSVYFPTSGQDDEFLNCIADLSNYIHDNSDSGVIIVIGADTNCSEKASKRRKRAFCIFLEEHCLEKISNGRSTFHHTNGLSESCIDFFLVSANRGITSENITTTCTMETPQNFSSHDPLSASLKYECRIIKRKSDIFSSTYQDFSQKKIIWDQARVPDYQSAVGKTLSYYDSFFSAPECIPLKCKLYSDILVQAAERTLTSSKPPAKSKRTRVSHKLHQAYQHLRRCYNIWKNEGKPRSTNHTIFSNYRHARSEVQRVRRHERNLQNIRTNNKIMQANYDNKHLYFKIIKNMRRSRPQQKLTVLHTPAGSYYGTDTLEGFASDAEILGCFVGESSAEYDNDFYRLCTMDNYYIFEFHEDEQIEVPHMSIEDLENILNKEMKLGKACDIYKVTVEHLRYAGNEAKKIILKLINDIIDNIYFLTCSQIKRGLSSAVHKGKKKPVSEASSYRRITVTPYIGSILDRYLDPISEEVFRKVQSCDQLGFTKDISYLMGAVERGECQRWALDRKETCFGVSFDGKAAFPSVDRNIQLRELYSVGERGKVLQYSRNIYQNTVSNIKSDGKISREFQEYKGARQGHKKSSGHFKAYINPCLTSTSSSKLGFYIGPICISSICIADDTYILSNDPRKLQALINIVGHYGKRYRLIFGPDKTKVIITGSKHDMQYYEDTKPWSLYDQKLNVSKENEHLGLIVSGSDEESKNVDKNIKSTRDTMFTLLGQTLSYQCKLSPAVQYNVWSVFIKPVLRSGLASLPVRPGVLRSLTSFHRRVLRGILKLSKYSPVVPLYFLLGELPIEAALHLDVMSLFSNIWPNP